MYSGSISTLIPQKLHTGLGEYIEVLEDEEGRNENGECAVCPTKTRDAVNLRHHEGLVHEFFRAVFSVPKQVDKGNDSEVS